MAIKKERGSTTVSDASVYLSPLVRERMCFSISTMCECVYIYIYMGVRKMGKELKGLFSFLLA